MPFVRQMRRLASVPLARATSVPSTSDVLSLPARFLRAADAARAQDPGTGQRIDVDFDRDTGKPSLQKPLPTGPSMEAVTGTWHGDEFHLTWGDGVVSKYSKRWLQDTLQKWHGTKEITDRVYGTGWTEETVRSSSDLTMDFDDVLSDTGMESALRSLHKYGILLVTNTPIHDGGGGVAALASALGGGSNKNRTSLVSHYKAKADRNLIGLDHGTDGPLRTLYGTVWSTCTAGQVPGASAADSAYGTDALALHTDLTYVRDPPGLQLFTMKQPSRTGGESVVCDGFAAAERLRYAHPEAFDMLSTTVRRYYCIDESTGWHLEASGTVISLDANDRVVMIRHNDLDRMPDLPVPCRLTQPEMNHWYDQLEAAHLAWDSILAQDDMRLVLRLQPGDTIIVSNQRWLHGRCSFPSSPEAPRAIMGCYVGQDELNSRFRRLGLYAH